MTTDKGFSLFRVEKNVWFLVSQGHVHEHFGQELGRKIKGRNIQLPPL
ncbi:MAG: hypothetical protein F6K17_20945 [Okeania sp. SIO3C4]|nr:hypothetical protein [Okeania sp. SIO3B3]NER04889.1 hypothetical protein [Okeania sp. SIO3C4]